MITTKMKALLLLIIATLALPVMAQKKQIREAEDMIKAGKNLDKAQKSMLTLLDDSANRLNPRVWTTLFDAEKALYEQGNEKLYLKLEYDTASLFRLAYQMFGHAQQLDSLELNLSANGKNKIKNRKKNVEFLNPIRQNLYFGGLYFVSKKNYNEAFNFLDRYITFRQESLFSDAPPRDSLQRPAYWAVYSGLRLNSPEKALRYFHIAQQDTAQLKMLTQFRVEIAEMQGDTATCLDWLNRGFHAYPTFPFFFPRLVDYYTSQGELSKAKEVVEYGLQADSTNAIFLFTKSNIMLNTGDYNGCINICKSLIERGDTIADAYLNAGLAYFDQAIEIDKNRQPSRQKMKLISQLYTEALPYLQKYRQMAPDKVSKWSLPLYTIYLNLNMGKEFDEINKIIQKNK